MTNVRVDPIELRKAIAGLERALADLPEAGHIVMPAGSARLLYAAALSWARSLEIRTNLSKDR